MICYAAVLLVIIIAVVIVKKVTSCLIKSIFMLVLIAVLAYIYFTYLQ